MRIVIEFCENPKKVISSIRHNGKMYTESLPYSDGDLTIKELKKYAKQKLNFCNNLEMRLK